jgi:arylsulfatase A-like enzyme
MARGFDHAYGPYGGIIDYFVHQYYQGLDWHRDGKPLVEEGYATTLFAREAERLVAAHDFAAKPLFLLFAPTAPHGPMQVPPEYVAPYAAIPDELRRTYAGMTAALDEAVGRLLDALAARGALENTLVVFLSDNGGAPDTGGRNDPLRGKKDELWEGGVRVPAIAWWPGVLPAGKTLQAPLHVIDLFPTLVRLAGGSLEQPLPLDGLDAWPAIARGEPLARQELLINAQAHQSALLAGDLKLVRTQSVEGPRVELYDVAADPGEKRDLAPRMRERVDELSDRLLAWQQEARRPLGPYPNKLPLGFAVPTVWGEPGSPPAPVGRRLQAPNSAPAP